jgi:hypothetical protein
MACRGVVVRVGEWVVCCGWWLSSCAVRFCVCVCLCVAGGGSNPSQASQRERERRQVAAARGDVLMQEPLYQSGWHAFVGQQAHTTPMADLAARWNVMTDVEKAHYCEQVGHSAPQGKSSEVPPEGPRDCLPFPQ